MQAQAPDRDTAGNLQALMPDGQPAARRAAHRRDSEQQTLIERCMDVITQLHTLEPPARAHAPDDADRSALFDQRLQVLASGRPLWSVTEPDVDADGNDVTGAPERGGNLAAVIIEATGGLGNGLQPHAVYDATLRAVACERAGLVDQTPADAFDWTDTEEPQDTGDRQQPLGPRSAATAALAVLLTRWRNGGSATNPARARGPGRRAGKTTRLDTETLAPACDPATD